MSITQNLVSVIIPTHNRAASLKNAIDSVLKQSHQNFEILIVANACEDETIALLKQLSLEDKRIIYFDIKDRIGAAAARNIALDKALGEYVAFLDDDDIWYAEKLATQISVLAKGEYALVGCNFASLNCKDKKPKKWPINTIRAKDFYRENFLGSFSFCLTKRSYIGKSRINEDLKAYQDWDLYLKILTNTALPAYVCADVLAEYNDFETGRISTDYKMIITAAQQFLQNWRFLFNKADIRYQQMRIDVLQCDFGTRKKWLLAKLPLFFINIISSSSRYHWPVYIKYIIRPFFQIIDIRRKMRRIKSPFHLQKYHIYHFIKRIFAGNKNPKNEGGGGVKLIVSLTSYPPRFNSLAICIESLLKQSLKADKVILWLAAEEVEKSPLPNNLTRLEKRGLEIKIVDENIKSYKKLIYTLEEFADDLIISCDDDFIYPKWFLQGLFDSYQQYPECISAYRCRLMGRENNQLTPYNTWQLAREQGPSYQLFQTTGGGVLYPPKALNAKVFDRIFLQLCPTGDDIWFKAMGLLNQTKTVMVKSKSVDFVEIKHSDTLWSINQNNNDEMIKNVFSHYQL